MIPICKKINNLNVVDIEDGSFSTTDGSPQYVANRIRTKNYIKIDNTCIYDINVISKYDDIYCQIYEYDETYTKLKYTGSWKLLPFKVCFKQETKYIKIVFSRGSGASGTLSMPDITQIIINTSPSDLYSQDETIIGQWIDGKPIYRKVYTGTLTTETTNYFYNDITGLSNTIDQIVHFGGYVDNNVTGGSKILNTLPNAWLNATYFPNEHRIRVYSYDKTWFPINSNYYLVVEYTKTTD